MSQAVDELLFQVKAAGLPEPVTEYPFAKSIGRKWRFDLAWVDRAVALECDGGAFIGGRHVTGTGLRSDSEKFSEAAAMGWRVLRVLPEHVTSGKALEWVEKALRQ